MKIVVGTRGSKLALTQTYWVVNVLKEKHPELEVDIEIIKTKGDLIQHLPLDKIGDKGLFTKEIEEQLLSGMIDIAVHSMKDMPSTLPEGLKFSYTPQREDVRDALILREGYNSISELPVGATIGTGSKRRKYQLLKLRPDLNVVPIRGNIDTRLRKLVDENLDGIVLAAAGLRRLGFENQITYYFPIEEMLPAPAQGALALEIRKEDEALEAILESIHDVQAAIAVKAERTFMNAIDGSCHMPMGAHCTVMGDDLILRGLFGDEEGTKLAIAQVEGKVGNEEILGEQLAAKIRKELE